MSDEIRFNPWTGEYQFAGGGGGGGDSLLLDQTSPQSVTGGAPIFEVGIDFGDHSFHIDGDDFVVEALAGGDFYIDGYDTLHLAGNTLVDMETAHIVTLEISGVYTFPTDDGTDGQVLTTDGDGNVTWEDGGSGSISPLTADLDFALFKALNFVIERVDTLPAVTTEARVVYLNSDDHLYLGVA